jgi:hypothetical protein
MANEKLMLIADADLEMDSNLTWVHRWPHRDSQAIEMIKFLLD